MKRFAVIFIMGLLLFGGQVMAAQVTNVELSYQEGAVVARIDVQGQIRFTHETEVPKNGRPDRVIVDILSATHELGGKEFLELPQCVVQSIRSSQFAVTPEKIVRVVFDLKKSPIYKVDVRDNSIILRFTDSQATSFATWSTAGLTTAAKKQKSPAVAAKPKAVQAKPQAGSTTATVARKNKAIENDRQASLGTESKAVKASPSPKAEPKQTEVKSKPAGFNQILAQTAPAPTAEKKPAAVKAEPVKKTAPKPKAPVQNPSGTKVKANAKSQPTPSAKPVKDTKKNVKKETAPSSLPKSASTKDLASAKAKAPKATVAKKTEAKPSQKVATKTETASDKKTSTSRFRRSAASNKIKGTLVAEFPKRLVVKYKSSHYRDPFKTLIDASRTQNDPVEQRIANVEGLKLVGIIDSDGGSNRALFEDKEGYGYMLKSGDKVRNGYVLRVETDRVYFQIFEYGWSRTVALKMD